MLSFRTQPLTVLEAVLVCRMTTFAVPRLLLGSIASHKQDYATLALEAAYRGSRAGSGNTYHSNILGLMASPHLVARAQTWIHFSLKSEHRHKAGQSF